MLSFKTVAKFLIATLCVLIVIGSAAFPCLLVVVTPLVDLVIGKIFHIQIISNYWDQKVDHIIILFICDYFHIFIISPTVSLPFVVEVTEYVHFAIYLVYSNPKHLPRILFSLLW